MVRTRRGKSTMEEAHSTTPALAAPSPAASPKPSLERSDTQTTAPLSDQDLWELQKELHTTQSSFMRLIDHYRSNQDVLGHEDHKYARMPPINAKLDALLNRKDTLEANPACVDPNLLDNRNNNEFEFVDVVNGVQKADMEMPLQTRSSTANTSFLTKLIQRKCSSVSPENFAPVAAAVQFVLPDAGQVVAVDNVANPVMASDATGHSPATENWPGVHNFGLQLLDLTGSTKNRTWDFSSQLNKLFIEFDKYTQIAFTTANMEDSSNLFLRVLPVYTSPGDLSEPVRRCPNHLLPSDPSNKEFPSDLLGHFVRVNHEEAVYETDPHSQRLSVVVPFQKPQMGSSYTYFLFKFMCLGSDSGGINRRPLMLVFTLEEDNQRVVGRQTLNLRVCSCPKRDRGQEECRANKGARSKVSKATIKYNNKQGSNPVKALSKCPPKKRKADSDLPFIMIPVALEDFEKLNELAEAAVIVRNKDREDEIKRKRTHLIGLHNENFIASDLANGF